MIKKEIYPKTPRLSCEGDKVYITEKLDGSNLTFFKKDDKLHICQRNNIFTLDELEEVKGITYKGLYQWLKDNGADLEKSLNESSAICGEWLGMGQIKYDVGDFPNRYYMFAKANINPQFELYNLKYDCTLFLYPFINEIKPCYISIVPLVCGLTNLPNKNQLDKLYENYCNKVNRNVEGFVVNYSNVITKYVRMKNGKLKDHFDREIKNDK